MTSLPLLTSKGIPFLVENWLGESHGKRKLKNSPSMEFPFIIFLSLLPSPRSPLSAQYIWYLGRMSISVVTPHLPFPSFTKNNRWWKLISLFPSPARETLIYFLCCVGNTEDESYYSGWDPAESAPCSTAVRSQAPNHCESQALLSPSWATAPGSGRHFDVSVLLNISFLLRTFCVSSGGIRHSYLCRAHRDMLRHLPVCNSPGDSREANVCARSIMYGSADFYFFFFFQNSF